jgi:predicted dehydrogenase
MKMLSVAVVGTGRFADTHIQTWQKIEGVRIVSVIGRDPQKASLLAKKYGIKKSYSDSSVFKEETPEIDIVDVVTVPSTHIDIALEFIDRSKGILIEKPLDVDMRKARKFVNEVKNKEVVIGVVSQLKYSENFRSIKGLLDDGDLGSIMNFVIQCSSLREEEYYSLDGGWRDTIAISGGGILMAQAIHRLNFLMSIKGYNVESVFAVQGPSRYAKNVEESVTAVFRMKDGTTGQLHVTSQCALETDYVLFEGTEGIVVTDFKDYEFIQKSTKESFFSKFRKKFFKKEIRGNETVDDFLLNQMNDFANIVRNKPEGEQNLIDALNDMIIINALYKSLSEKCPVRVDELLMNERSLDHSG